MTFCEEFIKSKYSDVVVFFFSQNGNLFKDDFRYMGKQN